MIRKAIIILAAALLALSCVRGGSDPYEGLLCNVHVQLVYPEGYASAAREGVGVVFEDMHTLARYESATGPDASVDMALPLGLYRVNVSDRKGTSIFNGTVDKFCLNKEQTLNIDLSYSSAGTLVIKEIYCGGCTKDPADGKYQSDKYVILHNNAQDVIYLDSLCFGTLAPYNSNSKNPWGSIQDFAPIIQAVWQFGGTGTSFPLNPGEDAVLCLNGAVDHTQQYHLSVNLNHEDYFVCYNNVYFTNTTYHPALGDKICMDHVLEVVEKMGKANAYTFSINSPAVVIFRPKDMTIREFLDTPGSIVQIPGSSVDMVVTLPWEWILDGVEVFNGSTNDNSKRVRSDVDAGYVTLSETHKGYSLMRKEDEELSAEMGYEVLEDTNNSSADFYERKTASLHD